MTESHLGSGENRSCETCHSAPCSLPCSLSERGQGATAPVGTDLSLVPTQYNEENIPAPDPVPQGDIGDGEGSVVSRSSLALVDGILVFVHYSFTLLLLAFWAPTTMIYYIPHNYVIAHRNVKAHDYYYLCEFIIVYHRSLLSMYRHF